MTNEQLKRKEENQNLTSNSSNCRNETTLALNINQNSKLDSARVITAAGSTSFSAIYNMSNSFKFY